MKKEYRFLYVLVIIKFILPFILQNHYYEPQRDEFLYLAEGHHMAWGYMAVPPLLSVFAWITNLFGNSMFWLRFFPSLFGAFTVFIVGKIIISLGGKPLALILGFLPFIFGAYLSANFLFQPGFLDVFFWTMIAYSILRFIQTQKDSWLYVFGICAGLGMMSKYSIAFFIISILIGLLITCHRKIFLNKHFYFSGLIAFLIFLPNLLWQYNYNFPVIVHMKELHQFQLQYVEPSGFLIDQILMNLAVVFFWIAGLYFIIFKEKGKYRIFAWAYLFLILILLYFQGKGYYALGAYPVLFAFGAIHLERFSMQHSKVWKYVFIIIPCVLGVRIMPIGFPMWEPARLTAYYEARNLEKFGLFKWEDLKIHTIPQDFADMLGWKEMTEKTAKTYHSLSDDEKRKTIIFTDNYGEAGAINYYGKPYGLPTAYTDNASFLYWMPDSLHIDNMILITTDKEEMQHSFLKDFSSAVLSDSISTKYAREKGSLILTLKGANKNVNQLFREKIKKDKARFIR